MPRNGTGQYQAPASTWNPGVNGVTALTADFNGLLDDLESGISQSVSSDGQTPMTGNLPMGNNKITGLANGAANTDAAAYGQVVHNIGQCRLTKSGSNLLLSPFNGNQLAINGTLNTIPSAGVSLVPGALTPSTLYYIYAYMSGATMTLEASTTGHSTDSTTGVEIKTGDASRTLVGMARPITGPAWVDTTTQRLVVSWFNQRPISLLAILGSDTLLNTVSLAQVSSTLDLEFLSWGTNSTTVSVGGSIITGTAGSSNYMAPAVDGVSPFLCEASITASATQRIPFSSNYFPLLSEGRHVATLYGQTTGNPAYARANSFTAVSIQG